MTPFQKMMMTLLLGFKPPLSDTVGTSQEFRCSVCLCLQYNYNAIKSPGLANH